MHYERNTFCSIYFQQVGGWQLAARLPDGQVGKFYFSVLPKPTVDCHFITNAQKEIILSLSTYAF